MTEAPSARGVALDPEWIPHAFDTDLRNLTFVHVPRAARAELLFLSDGQFKGQFRKATLPTADVAAATEMAPHAPLHFIFNTAFCCSTLLASALDLPGRSASLKEPNILVDVARHLAGRPQAESGAALELAVRLLERPLAPGEKLVAKPSNFANRALEPIFAHRPQSRAVLLYSDVTTFLGSIVKRGLVARINARKLYRSFAAWTDVDFGFSDEETFEQSDLQIAALAWLMQIAHFDAVARKFGPERALVIDAADLLAEPQRVLGQVGELFALGLTDPQLSDIVSGPVFSTHSKFAGLRYDQRARERDQEQLVKAHREELDMVVHWVKAVAAHIGVPLKPGVRA